MAEPIVQDIVDEVISRLQNISVANGYEFDAGTVEVVSRDADEWEATSRCIIVEQGQEQENEEMFCPGNPPRVAYDLPLSIYGYAKQLDVDATVTGVTDQSTTENQMASAIKKALANNDAGEWHTFDGNAIDASWPTVEHFDEPGWDGAMVTLTVSYRTSEVDPYVVG